MALSIANRSGGQQSDGANCGEEIRVVYDVFDANTPHNFPIAKPILSSVGATFFDKRRRSKGVLPFQAPCSAADVRLELLVLIAKTLRLSSPPPN